MFPVVQVRVARIFNTFGDRMNLGDGRVVSNFIVQALQGKPITVYGQGQQVRTNMDPGVFPVHDNCTHSDLQRSHRLLAWCLLIFFFSFVDDNDAMWLLVLSDTFVPVCL